MNYQISAINQAGVVDAGLHEKTDVVDWALLDYIFAWQLSPTAKRIDDKFWINYAHLISEMPLLGLNGKGAVGNRIKKIRELGLIETYQHPVDCRLYAKTTTKYYEITQFRAVEKPSKGVHENEQGVHENEQGVHENEHSTVNHYPLTKNSKDKREDAPKPEPVIVEKEVKVKAKFVEPTLDEVIAYCLAECLNMNAETFYYFYAQKDWMVGKNKMKSWTMAAKGWATRQKEFSTNTGNGNANNSKSNQKISAAERVKRACKLDEYADVIPQQYTSNVINCTDYSHVGF